MSDCKRAIAEQNDGSEWLLLQIRSAFKTIREKSLHRRGSYLIRDEDLEIPTQKPISLKQSSDCDQDLVK